MKRTAKTWFDLLPIVADRGWKVNQDGEIRDKKGYCPICALANEVSGGKFKRKADYDIAAEEVFGIELSYWNNNDLDAVVRAADDGERPEFYFPATSRAHNKNRKQLEQVLGLRTTA